MNWMHEDLIGVLELVKRRELEHNAKINKLCTSPSESVGAKAIDEAITRLKALKAIAADRDSWREYAAAVVRALRRHDNGDCFTCAYRKSQNQAIMDMCRGCAQTDDFVHWELDKRYYEKEVQNV